MSEDAEIPEATTEPPQVPELRLGEPFAISYGCDLLDAGAVKGGGCFAVVKCDCEQMFRVNLLDGEVKYCPNCNAAFTHALLVGPQNSTEIVAGAMSVVLESNGIPVDNPDDDEGDEGEGEGDDDEGDEGEDNPHLPDATTR